MTKVASLLLVLLGFGVDAVTAGAATGGGDTTVADMFSTAGDGSQPTTATTGTTTTPIDAGATTPAAFQLRAGDSVYSSIEEAQRGIEHKDNLIQLLRNQEIQRTGVDPITGQRVGVGQTHQMGQPQAPVRYVDNPNQYANDLTEAAQLGAKTGDYRRYQEVQSKFQHEQMEAQFAPIMPVIQNFVESSAVQQVSAQAPDFPKFYASPEFKKTIEASPLLKMGIDNAKTNPAFASHLPELYKQVFTVWENNNLKAQLAQFQKAQQTQPPSNVRPTAQPTTLQPQTGNNSQADWRTDAAARKQFIDNAMKSGLGDQVLKF